MSASDARSASDSLPATPTTNCAHLDAKGELDRQMEDERSRVSREREKQEDEMKRLRGALGALTENPPAWMLEHRAAWNQLEEAYMGLLDLTKTNAMLRLLEAVSDARSAPDLPPGIWATPTGLAPPTAAPGVAPPRRGPKLTCQQGDDSFVVTWHVDCKKFAGGNNTHDVSPTFSIRDARDDKEKSFKILFYAEATCPGQGGRAFSKARGCSIALKCVHYLEEDAIGAVAYAASMSGCNDIKSGTHDFAKRPISPEERFEFPNGMKVAYASAPCVISVKLCF